VFFINTIKKIFERINTHFLTLQDTAKYKKNKNLCFSLDEDSISNILNWLAKNSIKSFDAHTSILIVTSHSFEPYLLGNLNNLEIIIVFSSKISHIKSMINILNNYKISEVKILFLQLSRMLIDGKKTEFYDVLCDIKLFNQNSNCEVFFIDQAELLGDKKTAFIKKLFF